MAVLADIVVPPDASRRDHRRNERDLFESYMLSYLGAEAIYNKHPMRMFMGVRIIDVDQKFVIVEMPENNRLGAHFAREVFSVPSTTMWMGPITVLINQFVMFLIHKAEISLKNEKSNIGDYRGFLNLTTVMVCGDQHPHALTYEHGTRRRVEWSMPRSILMESPACEHMATQRSRDAVNSYIEFEELFQDRSSTWGPMMIPSRDWATSSPIIFRYNTNHGCPITGKPPNKRARRILTYPELESPIEVKDEPVNISSAELP